ncbi:ATP-binding protein [Salipiger pacificus]|nr:ATP-binding protein [Alloyangia pacifica]
MSFNLSSIQSGATNANRPPILICYGVHGVGKTTLGAMFPNPILLRCEDGLGGLAVDAFPKAETFDDVMTALQALATEDHGYQTLVVDSLDWLEPMVWEQTCRNNGWQSIEEPGFGKGYVATMDQWREYMDAVNYLRDAKGMTIFQIAHTDIRTFEDPNADSYSRYEIKLHKKASALVQEHADAILFANYRVSVKTSEGGFGAKKARAIGSGERLLYTEERPSFLAKNRYGMDPSLPMEFGAIAHFIPALQGAGGNA